MGTDDAGSAVMRWHNILRTGLDFEEVARGRVSIPLDPPRTVLAARGLKGVPY
jgi:hypothetical protein